MRPTFVSALSAVLVAMALLSGGGGGAHSDRGTATGVAATALPATSKSSAEDLIGKAIDRFKLDFTDTLSRSASGPAGAQGGSEAAKSDAALAPILRSLARTLKNKQDLKLCMPELDILSADGYGVEAAALFGNLTQAWHRLDAGDISSAHGKGAGADATLATLRALLAAVEDLDPLRFASLRSGYPVMRRAVAAFVVQVRYATR